MTQLRERVHELASRGLSEYSIHKTLKTEGQDLTRHRVRVLLSEPKESALARFQLPQNKPPIYQGGPSLEEHADTWETVDQSLQNHYWYLGAIAGSLDTGYGRGSIKDFAALVGKSPERIYQLLRTYRAFESKEISAELWFTHYQYAAESDKPEYWIRRVLESSPPMSTRKLEELIKGKSLPDFRIKEPEPVQDAEFRPVTSNGYGPFPPDELVQPEPHVKPDPVQVIEPPFVEASKAGKTYKAWKDYVRSHPCYVCGSHEVEAAHIECLPSTKQSGLIPRLNGLGQWPCLPICAHHHRNGPESVHAIGERAFFESHRGADHAIGYVMRLLLEFFTG